MTDKQLVNFWIYGTAKKIDQTEDGVWLDWGGNKYYLSWEQVGTNFAALGKTEADIKMFMAKQWGYKVGYEDLEKFYQKKASGGFAGAEDDSWFTAGLKALGGFFGWKGEKEKAAAAEAQARATQAGWLAKIKETETIQKVALIGATALVAVVLLKRRKK